MMAAMARADAPVPAKDEVVLTLTAKPPFPIEGDRFTGAAGGWVFLEMDRTASSPQSGSEPFMLVTPGTLSIDRVGLESRSSDGQKSLYRVEDFPGPGYRKILEWYENMKRPLPKTAP